MPTTNTQDKSALAARQYGQNTIDTSKSDKSILGKRVYGSKIERLEHGLAECPFCGGAMKFHEEQAGKEMRDDVRRLYVQCTRCKFAARFPVGHLREVTFSSDQRYQNEKIYIKTSNFWNRLKHKLKGDC